MDFDLDDPLGDLLSDGSNDSFFGTTPKKSTTSKTTEKSTGLDAKAKSKVADLFSIENEPTKPRPLLDDSDALAAKPSIQVKPDLNILERKGSVSATHQYKSPTSPTKAPKISEEPKKSSTESMIQPRKETKFDDSDDFLSELGFDPKNPKGSTNKKSNILDDLLNFSKQTTESHVSQPKTAPNSVQAMNKPPNTVIENKVQEMPSNATAFGYSPSLGRARNLPRTTSASSGNDPLGFFSTPTKKPPAREKEETREKEASSRPKLTKKVSVDWLGLDDTNETEVEIEKRPPAQPTREFIEKPKTFEAPKLQEPAERANVIPSVHSYSKMSENSTHAVPLVLNGATIDNDRILNSLQQQESQLKMVSQMKQQENALVDFHSKQKSLLKQQECQFNQLLHRQIDRQSQLECQIQQQQEQINAYINVLLSQPNTGLLSSASKREIQPESDDNHNEHNNIILEADLKRLELEKLRLEDVLQSVQSSHEQELDLLHTSHKKQIAILEENFEKLEQRFRAEIESIEHHHLDKFNLLNADMETQQHKYEEQIAKLTAEYEKHNEKVRIAHEAEIESMKNDCRATIENIRQSKLYEFATLHEGSSYLNTLKSASENLESATDNLQAMRSNIDANIERLHAEREIQLNIKEKRLNDQQTSVDKMVEKTEMERTKLIELVKCLELKLSSIEQSSTEEQWSLRQKSASLDAERKSFEREKEFIREKMATEEKRIMELKELHFAEHKRMMDLIDAERQEIFVEKAKLETMERLNTPKSDSLHREKELDAAIRIAQDAAKAADTEREKLVERQRKLEMDKRELMDKETQLRTQQTELELNINQAKDQKRAAEHISRSCKLLERKFFDKMRGLQENFADLTDRETKLSQAKIHLSKERIALQNVAQQLRQSKCSLCRIGIQNRDLSEMDPLMDIKTKLNSTKTNLPHHPIMDDFDSGLPTVDDILATESRIDSFMPLFSPHKWNYSLYEAKDIESENEYDADLNMAKMNAV